MIEAPQYPIGPMAVDESQVWAQREELIRQIEETPKLMRKAVEGLTDAQLDTKYKNWNIRQIVNHLADSHMNGYLRFKYALTMDDFKATAYSQDAWAGMPDILTGNLEPTLTLLEGLHARWTRMMRAMNEDQFRRTYLAYDGKPQSLLRPLGIYAWHGRHHTGQILWMRENRFR